MNSQPYFAEGTPAMHDLEEMVDKVGVRNVLYALAHIAAQKAEHVACNWQDKALAKEWDRTQAALMRAAGKITSPLDTVQS